MGEKAGRGGGGRNTKRGGSTIKMAVTSPVWIGGGGEPCKRHFISPGIVNVEQEMNIFVWSVLNLTRPGRFHFSVSVLGAAQRQHFPADGE